MWRGKWRRKNLDNKMSLLLWITSFSSYSIPFIFKGRRIQLKERNYSSCNSINHVGQHLGLCIVTYIYIYVLCITHFYSFSHISRRQKLLSKRWKKWMIQKLYHCRRSIEYKPWYRWTRKISRRIIMVPAWVKFLVLVLDVLLHASLTLCLSKSDFV
jgi:hypothetical protein